MFPLPLVDKHTLLLGIAYRCVCCVCVCVCVCVGVGVGVGVGLGLGLGLGCVRVTCDYTLQDRLLSSPSRDGPSGFDEYGHRSHTRNLTLTLAFALYVCVCVFQW